jgi:alkylation response protein AidB-like acyl-CoA dehydrogenase
MDMEFSNEHRDFQEEVRAFIAENFVGDLKEKSKRTVGAYLEKEDHIRWQKKLYEKGWMAPNWPVEYGGTGWDATQRYIFETEMARAGTPRVPAFGYKMVAPVIMGYGTEEQKKKFLPDILQSKVWWCQGYSEPGSGSDLASLQTRAVADGDDYIVNGSKIWTTRAQDADWIFCLVRTSSEGKKQEGITFLLIDMTSPGIRVEPIITLEQSQPPHQEVNQVFFDDVRVPQENRVGQENDGWTVAKYLLEFERGNAYSGSLMGGLDKLRLMAHAERSDGGRLIDDFDFSAKLAAMEIEVRGVETTELMVLSALAGGQRTGPISSMLKCRGTDTMQAITEMAVEAAGYYAQTDDMQVMSFGSNMPPIGPDYAVTAAGKYFNTRKASIYGGSNEIQRNIMAKLVLGL